MTRLFKLLVLAPFLAASLAVQADEGQWYIAPSAVYTDDDGDRRLDDSFAGDEARLGWRLTDKYALEGVLGYHKIDGWPSWPDVQERESQKFLDLGLNVVRRFNPHGSYSPYLLVGGGHLGTETDLGVKDSSPTGTAGVGLNVNFGESPWSLRAEWRWRHAFDSQNGLTDQLGSLGIQYSFGGRSNRTVLAAVSEPEPAVSEPETVAFVDTDGDRDGITDDRDDCPGTGAGVTVDSSGCELIETAEFKSVYFETESATLFDIWTRKLDAAVATLLSNPDLRVEIAGHADSRGPEDYNMALSVRRAEVVRRYLEQAGVDTARLTVRGYGESEPIASNETMLGQAENRRVELRVLDR